MILCCGSPRPPSIAGWRGGSMDTGAQDSEDMDMSNNAAENGIPQHEVDAARERMSGITFAMYRNFPFFALLAESCNIRMSDDCPTACVDRRGNITFGREFMSKLNDGQLIFILAHEVFHVAFAHFDRRGSRDPFLWNVAADYAINLLVRDGMSTVVGSEKRAPAGCIPNNLLMDDKYADMSTEQIYEDIIKNAKKVKVKVKCSLSGDMKDDGDDDGQSVSIKSARAKTPDTTEGWQQAVATAMTRAKQCGKLPESLERAVGDFLKSKVDWAEQLRQMLRHGVSRINRDFYTFVPCNRRFVHQGVYIPSLVGYDAPKIAFAIDTSGSMGDEEMSQAHAEIDSIRKQFGCPVYVMSCDADVHSGEWVGPYSDLPMPVGGGGTDFRPVFSHLIDNRIPADIVVYLTDGYGEFGDDPGIETIWVMTTHEAPPWGSHVQIGVDA